MQIFFLLFDVPFDLAPGQDIFGCVCSDPSFTSKSYFVTDYFVLFRIVISI